MLEDSVPLFNVGCVQLVGDNAAVVVGVGVAALTAYATLFDI